MRDAAPRCSKLNFEAATAVFKFKPGRKRRVIRDGGAACKHRAYNAHKPSKIVPPAASLRAAHG